MGRFEQKVVLITGASSGIGEALAREFAKEGAGLVLTARRGDRLESLARELEKGGTKALAVAGDVTVDGDLEKVATAAREKFGRIDVVVANAGFGVIARLEKLQVEDYRRQLETNVFGVLRTVYATLADLKKSGGTLVLMGSVFGHISSPEGSPYAMSKFAIRALADSLYAELAPQGVAVVHLCPGFITSELRHKNKQGVYRPDSKDPVPQWIQMPTEQAARQIVTAVAKKRRETVITFHGKFAAFIGRHFPGILPRIFKKMSKKYSFER